MDKHNLLPSVHTSKSNYIPLTSKANETNITIGKLQLAKKKLTPIVRKISNSQHCLTNCYLTSEQYEDTLWASGVLKEFDNCTKFGPDYGISQKFFTYNSMVFNNSAANGKPKKFLINESLIDKFKTLYRDLGILIAQLSESELTDDNNKDSGGGGGAKRPCIKVTDATEIEQPLSCFCYDDIDEALLPPSSQSSKQSLPIAQGGSSRQSVNMPSEDAPRPSINVPDRDSFRRSLSGPQGGSPRHSMNLPSPDPTPTDRGSRTSIRDSISTSRNSLRKASFTTHDTKKGCTVCIIIKCNSTSSESQDIEITSDDVVHEVMPCGCDGDNSQKKIKVIVKKCTCGTCADMNSSDNKKKNLDVVLDVDNLDKSIIKFKDSKDAQDRNNMESASAQSVHSVQEECQYPVVAPVQESHNQGLNKKKRAAIKQGPKRPRNETNSIVCTKKQCNKNTVKVHKEVVKVCRTNSEIQAIPCPYKKSKNNIVIENFNVRKTNNATDIHKLPINILNKYIDIENDNCQLYVLADGKIINYMTFSPSKNRPIFKTKKLKVVHGHTKHVNHENIWNQYRTEQSSSQLPVGVGNMKCSPNCASVDSDITYKHVIDLNQEYSDLSAVIKLLKNLSFKSTTTSEFQKDYLKTEPPRKSSNVVSVNDAISAIMECFGEFSFIQRHLIDHSNSRSHVKFKRRLNLSVT